MWRIRVDEEEALANSYEFNKLLLTNDVTLETTSEHVSKLNKIIERPNRDSHVKKRIAMGLTTDLPNTTWCFSRDMHCLLKDAPGNLTFSPILTANGTAIHLTITMCECLALQVLDSSS